MYRSYSVSNMPEPIEYEPKREEKPEKKREERPVKEEHCLKRNENKRGGLLDNIQTDDIILAVVILALLSSDCDDKLLIAALAFIFLTDFF